MSSRWVIKTRNYELDDVKYLVKPKPITKDQDPLTLDISAISSKSKKTSQAKKNITKSQDDKPDKPMLSSQVTKPKMGLFDGLTSSKPPTSMTSSTKMFAGLSRATNVKSTTAPSTPTSTSSSVSTSAAATPSKKDANEIIMPYNAKKVEDLKHLQYSLIVNKDFNVDDSIEVNWTCLKKNLMDLFCNNFNMEVKSLYSFDFSDDLKNQYNIEKGRSRMDELESSKQDFDVVTSGQFVEKMDVIKREMITKWDKEDKVGTLKIIIQCTKMLNDVFTPKFYTHKFLLISDILDNFAKLVYERVLKLSFGTKNHVDFSKINPTVGTQTAKDVVSNWIYKCICIRELLPRIYIDISFLGIFKFIMNNKELEKKILTIAQMISGISHPLVAFYVGMYLTKVVLQLFPKSKQFMYVLLRILSKFELDADMIKRLNYENITIQELRKVLDPCIEWVVYCSCKNMSGKDFKNLMKVYDDTKNYFILKGIIIHAPVKFLFNEDYLAYLFACFEIYNEEESVFLSTLVSQKILISDFPIESVYIATMWEKIKKTKDKAMLIDSCGLLGEILIKYHDEDIQEKFFEEVFDMFKNTFSVAATADLSPSEVQKYFAKVEVFLYGILTKITNYSGILSGDNFLFLLENFTPELKLNICNSIIKQIVQTKDQITDPYLSYSLIKIGRYIHDTIQVNTPKDKKKEIADIIIKLLYKIDFGVDFENYINFLTEARSYYTDLEDVMEVLITEAQKVAIQTYKIVRGKHNKKTLRFCKVCISYCQITIPCIFSIQTQLKLQLTTAQIALMNNLLSECDSLIRSIIGSIEKQVLENLDKNESEFIINFTKALLGFMVLVPSDPENPFELIKMVLEIFSSELLQKTNLVKKTKMSIYPAAIKYLTTLMQNKLPYHIANVESNDEIFTGDENFEMEGREIIESIINQILTDVSEFNEKLKPFETEDCEFLTMLCSECFEVFKYNFEETKFQINVQNKMLQLIEKFIGMLETNKMFQGNKTEKLKNYFIQLTKN